MPETKDTHGEKMKEIRNTCKAWREVIERIHKVGSEVLSAEFDYWWEALLMDDLMADYRLPGYEIDSKIVLLSETDLVQLDLLDYIEHEPSSKKSSA